MKQAGFTYLELLIAVGLFSVGIVSVLQIFPVNRFFLAQSAQTTQAAFLAQEELETIRSLPYASLTAGTYEAQHALGASSSDPLNQFKRQTVVSLIDGNHTASIIDLGLKQVVITLTWQQRTLTRTYVITTYVHQ